MRKIVLFAVLCLLSPVIRGADIPSVLLLTDSFSEKKADYIEKRIASDLIILDITSEPVVSCRIVAGIADAAKYFAVNAKEYDVLVLLCRDIESNKKICREISVVADRNGVNVLWMASDGGFIAGQGWYYADYDGFRANLARYDEDRCIAYLSDAVAQWWTGMAKGNKGIRRVPLWGGHIPDYEYAGPEYINSVARIDRISEPELEVFLPEQRTKAPVVVFFPGGGLSFTGFVRNAREAAELLIPQGVAVVGVKYRVKRGLDIALQDARHAIRTVRENADEWNIDPDAVLAAGQSAGALIVLRLASSDNTLAEERPDYVVPLTSWYYGKDEWPFEFTPDAPSFFMRHATNDSGYKLALDIKAKVQEAGVSIDWKTVDDGGHGAFEITGDGYGHGWVSELVEWMKTKGIF